MSVVPATSARPRSMWQDLRHSVSALFEDLGRYLLASVAWLLSVTFVLLLARRQPGAAVGAIVVVPVASGLGRMAARSARGERPTRWDFRDGLTHRLVAAWGIGAVAVAVMLLTALNLSLADGGATLSVMSAIVSVHVAVLTSAAVASIWPVLMDPARDDIDSRAAIRLGLVVLAVYPRALALLVVVEGALALAQVTVLATAFVLPGTMVLLAAFVVLPRADRLSAPPPTVP